MMMECLALNRRTLTTSSKAQETPWKKGCGGCRVRGWGGVQGGRKSQMMGRGAGKDGKGCREDVRARGWGGMQQNAVY